MILLFSSDETFADESGVIYAEEETESEELSDAWPGTEDTAAAID